MVVGAEIFSVPVLDVQYRCIAKGMDEFDASAAPPDSHARRRQAEVVSMEIAASELHRRVSYAVPDMASLPAGVPFVPRIRSGSHSDIGPRRFMEDEHICVDDLAGYLGPDLAGYLGPVFRCPTPCSFYGVFDGHGGAEAAVYLRKNVMRLIFEDSDFSGVLQAKGCALLEELHNSMNKAFLLADLAMADTSIVSPFCGTTVLTALVLGRLLLVANVGDCRAVLCRKGRALDMSQDHRPCYPSELQRVKEESVKEGYLYGDLSVTRALGDWDMKLMHTPSALIADPEFQETVLTEDDEFLIIGCDGIWDVMSSQHAVSTVRRGLRRHDDPEQCARELIREALRLHSPDNLTVIVVCFSNLSNQGIQRPRRCTLSAEALCELKKCLEWDGVDD